MNNKTKHRTSIPSQSSEVCSTTRITKMFTQDKLDVVYQAVINLGGYDFLENTPRASFTCNLVEEIERLGYKIVKS